MTDPVLIFREEALRSRDAQPPQARPQRPEPPRWIAAAYWALLALIAAGLAAGLLIRDRERSPGPGGDPGRRGAGGGPSRLRP
jgi:hypothetical protein